MKRLVVFCVLPVLLFAVLGAFASAQITPSDDAYTLTSQPTTNFGAKNTLEVESAGATAFIRFDLSGIPPTVTGSYGGQGHVESLCWHGDYRRFI